MAGAGAAESFARTVKPTTDLVAWHDEADGFRREGAWDDEALPAYGWLVRRLHNQVVRPLDRERL
jgi:hypothetical protein